MGAFPVSGAEISMYRYTFTGAIGVILTLDAGALPEFHRRIGLYHFFYRYIGCKE